MTSSSLPQNDKRGHVPLERNETVILSGVKRSEESIFFLKVAMDKKYYVYILTNRKYGVLYTGVTNNLMRRVYEHKQKLIEGFSKKYNLTLLVYYEETSDVYSAIAREKQIKGWLRQKKIDLIESRNPKWEDLSQGWFE